MIYTVTLGPSLDYAMEYDRIEIGGLNRARTAGLTAGGKGINVSKVLTHLGLDNLMLGFVGGFVGDEIERQLSAGGYESEFIRLESGVSRINVKARAGFDTTQLNAPGPEIPRSAMEKLETQLARLKKGDFVVLAGNIPEGMPDYTYSSVMEKVSAKGADVVVDASGNALLSTLSMHPFLVKPNREELEGLFSTKIRTREEVDKYALELIKKGARNVLVSLDQEGALLACDHGSILYQAAPEGRLVNPVGAGDAMVAGFLWGYCSAFNGEASEEVFREALKCGVSAGTASAFSPGLASGDDIRAIRRRL
ncbi:MAG: 1-phosphofructokinase family hexose kinase [Lachnospiraceae bacterium]|nr:1-phosphofructokinase family hexose kinase [Lachnospiraceae bacterium]